MNKILLNLLQNGYSSRGLWFIETKSSLQTQRNFRTKYGTDPPSRPSIRARRKKFMEKETVFDKGKSERPRTFEQKKKKKCRSCKKSSIVLTTNGAHIERNIY